MLKQDSNVPRLIATSVCSLILVFGLAACEQSLKISDKELVERVAECHSDTLTPGAAVSCGNYLKECARRGKKTGNYLC